MRHLARPILFISAFFGFSLSCLPLAHTETELLRSYRWESRILLMFATDDDDVRFQNLRQKIEQKACEVKDRDLLMGFLFSADSEQQSTFADKTLSANEVKYLRDSYNPEASDFAVVLIGKDGGTKLRSTTLTDLQPIFSRIDGMPMRRQEMGDHRTQC